ncbi:hypothetical protein [Sodalis sp. dw_96]|uniref:hypothetical protein n=1 Tax=Sodalis sp. dw_96 TaxID=2719794 RepID=UPI001BD368B9|nr:hypothetical protein [Sodalis sp. dw_96]
MLFNFVFIVFEWRNGTAFSAIGENMPVARALSAIDENMPVARAFSAIGENMPVAKALNSGSWLGGLLRAGSGHLFTDPSVGIKSDILLITHCYSFIYLL